MSLKIDENLFSHDDSRWKNIHNRHKYATSKSCKKMNSQEIFLPHWILNTHRCGDDDVECELCELIRIWFNSRLFWKYFNQEENFFPRWKIENFPFLIIEPAETFFSSLDLFVRSRQASKPVKKTFCFFSNFSIVSAFRESSLISLSIQQQQLVSLKKYHITKILCAMHRFFPFEWNVWVIKRDRDAHNFLFQWKMNCKVED